MLLSGGGWACIELAYVIVTAINKVHMDIHYGYPSVHSFRAAAAVSGGAWLDLSGGHIRALPLNSVADPEISWAWAVYGRVDSSVRPTTDDERSTLTLRNEEDGRVLTVRVESVSMQQRRRASGIIHTVVLSRRRAGPAAAPRRRVAAQMRSVLRGRRGTADVVFDV